MILTQKVNSIDIKKTKENTTGLMGLSWIYHLAKHYGVCSDIEKIFPRKKSNREINAEKKIMSCALMMLAGGEKIEDIEKLRADKAFIGSLGWNSMVSPDAFLEYLAIIRNGGRIRKLNEIEVIKAMQKSELDDFTYDNDATYFNSGKDCAEWSYKEEKQMSALLGFLPELSGLCITMDYRPGNISPASGIENQIRKAVKLAKQAGKRIARVRIDSAGYKKKIMKRCHQENIKFFIVADKDKAVMNTIHNDIHSSTWKEVPERNGVEYSTCRYWLMDKDAPIETRMLVLRWHNPDPTLFDQSKYCYRAIVTNDFEINALEWLAFQDGRMASENYNKEIKTGLSCNYTPSHDFNKNRNYFLVGILAYNILQIMKLFYFEEHAKKWTIKTVRFWFIQTCGRVVKHARKVVCNLINCTDLTYSLFQGCLKKVVVDTT